MSILHLLKNTMSIYSPAVTVDAVGGHRIAWSLVSTLPCRIEQLNQSREVILGRDNTQATHRIYLTDTSFGSLDYDRIVNVNNKFYEIIDFEQLDPIMTGCSILHVELYVRYKEQSVIIAPTPPTPEPSGIGYMIIGSSFIVG